jgi:NTE family protein
VNLNALHPFEHATETNPDWHELDKNNSSMLSGFQRKLNKMSQPNKQDSPGYFHLINETSGMMLAHILNLTFQMNPPDFLIEISKDACGTFDFYKANDMIKLGKITTNEALKSIKGSNS